MNHQDESELKETLSEVKSSLEKIRKNQTYLIFLAFWLASLILMPYVTREFFNPASNSTKLHVNPDSYSSQYLMNMEPDLLGNFEIAKSKIKEKIMACKILLSSEASMHDKRFAVNEVRRWTKALSDLSQAFFLYEYQMEGPKEYHYNIFSTEKNPLLIKLETATSEAELNDVEEEFLASYPFELYQWVKYKLGLFKIPEPVKTSWKESMAGKPENSFKPYKKNFLVLDGEKVKDVVTCYSDHPIPGEDPSVEKIVIQN